MSEIGEILSRKLRKGRVHVTVKNGGSVVTIPHANYVWLKSNPSFMKIPKGYAIHHLDGNSLNDDPSNLVIMHKVLHRAYHLKNLIPTVTDIEIDESVENDISNEEPYKKPHVMFYRRRNIYIIRYRIKNNGVAMDKSVYSFDNHGTNFKTEEEAARAIDVLWPHKPWLDRRYDKIKSVGQSK